jgi:hypothetical protein
MLLSAFLSHSSILPSNLFVAFFVGFFASCYPHHPMLSASTVVLSHRSPSSSCQMLPDVARCQESEGEQNQEEIPRAEIRAFHGIPIVFFASFFR